MDGERRGQDRGREGREGEGKSRERRRSGEGRLRHGCWGMYASEQTASAC